MSELEDKIIDLSLYKKTELKKFNVFICKPKIGTKCWNRIDNKTVINTEDKPYIMFVGGGDYITVSLKELENEYITTGNNSVNEHIVTKHSNKDGTMRWIRAIRKKTEECYWALEIEEKGSVNIHGKEMEFNSDCEVRDCNDFVVCRDNNGVPDISTVSRVNGTRFLSRYKVSGFIDLSGYDVVLYDRPKFDIVNGEEIQGYLELNTEQSDKQVISRLSKSLRGTKPTKGNIYCSTNNSRYTLSIVKLNGKRYVRIQKFNRKLSISCWTNFVPVTSNTIAELRDIIYGKEIQS